MTVSRNPEEEHYALLPHGDSDSAEYVDVNRPQQKRSSWFNSTNSSSVLSWVFALFVIIAATDGFALFYMLRIMKTVYADLSTDNLDFANPYYGLAELYRSGQINSSKIEPIQNVPRVVAQVFTDRPQQLAPVGEHDLFNKMFGTMSPHEKHLQVSPTTHTIAQVRALDFGMEECTLVIQLPANGDPIESKEPFHFNPSSLFDVFRLDAPKPIDVRKLSYNTKPPVKDRVATITARAGEETLVSRFPCAWGSLHTFEVACAEGSQCLVDVWSSQNTTYGVYVYQHQTI